MSELSNDTLKIGISLAILCHCFGLMFLTAPAPSEEDFPMTVIVKLDSAQAAVSEQGQSLGMESVSENSLTEKKVADKKREIYLQYLEDVSLCIHARRFLEPNSHGLIGIALYKIRVNADGIFTAADLYKSSGNKQLDRAGLTAVRACSGFVKRPPSTGVQPMNIFRPFGFTSLNSLNFLLNSSGKQRNFPVNKTKTCRFEVDRFRYFRKDYYLVLS